ncbi:protein FAM151B isoform X2 [Rhodnius prolixus]|uniref:Menorin-like domain-containing protein n=1 Tax=Rhodnius prolixus TaxID=13249 RepID=R4G2X7_RHOPR
MRLFAFKFIFIFLLNDVFQITMTMPEPLREYFPEIGHDLTLVTWEHAVNSKEKLEKALAGDSLMIEADISLGYVIGDVTKELRPIMAHPPANTSDLSLEDFLYIFSKSSARKGIKLDFKSKEAFSHSEFILEASLYNRDVDYPVWLNADIIKGPVNSEVQPVDADYFLSRSVTKFPVATLSVGWTTRFGNGIDKGEYTVGIIEEMTDALNRNLVTSPVTFAVRAAIAAQSYEQLSNLIGSSVPGTTLTIWCGSNDKTDLNLLRRLIHGIGRDKIYLDLPPEMIVDLAFPVVSGTDIGKQSPLVSAAILALGSAFLAR